MFNREIILFFSFVYVVAAASGCCSDCSLAGGSIRPSQPDRCLGFINQHKSWCLRFCCCRWCCCSCYYCCYYSSRSFGAERGVRRRKFKCPTTPASSCFRQDGMPSGSRVGCKCGLGLFFLRDTYGRHGLDFGKRNRCLARQKRDRAVKSNNQEPFSAASRATREGPTTCDTGANARKQTEYEKNKGKPTHTGEAATRSRRR